MKVVHLSTSDTGGAGIAASRIHKGLLHQGVSSSFISLRKYRTDIPQAFSLKDILASSMTSFQEMQYFIKRLQWHTKIVDHPYYTRRDIHLAGKPSGFEMFSIPDSAYDLTIIEKVKEADIVHLHWVSEGFLDYASFFRKMKKKVVWTLHDMNPFTGGCHHADDCTGFLNECKRCPQLKGTIDENFALKIQQEKNEALQFMLDRQMEIVSPSQWMLEKASKSTLFWHFPHIEIPNPVDDRIFYPIDKIEARRELGLPEDKKIVLFIAKDVDNERKGVHYLTDAVSSDGFRADFKICSVGNLSKPILPDYMHINLGYIDDENKMALIYSAVDLFVLPSLAENLPNTICEALLCGTPVVAFDVGGIPSMVNKSNGVLVELKNSKKLLQAILDVLNEKIKFDRMSIAAQAKGKFSESTITDKYISVYNHLL